MTELADSHPENGLPLLRLNAGACFRLEYSERSVANMAALDLLDPADPDHVLLHVKPRPDRGDMVLNDRCDGRWGRAVSIAYDAAARPALVLRFAADCVHLRSESGEETRLDRFGSPDRQVLARIPAGITLTPIADGSGGETDPWEALADPPEGFPGARTLRGFVLHLHDHGPLTPEDAALLRASGLTGVCVPVRQSLPMVPDDVDLAILPVWSDGRDPWLGKRLAETEWRDLGPVAAALADRRTLRISGRPVLVVAAQTLAKGGARALRTALTRLLGTQPLLILGQADRPARDPRNEGYDAALGFPPRPSTDLHQTIAADLATPPRPWPVVPVLPPMHDEVAATDLQSQWLRARARRALIGPLPECPMVILDRAPALALSGAARIAGQALRAEPSGVSQGLGLLIPADDPGRQVARDAAALLRSRFGASVLPIAAAESATITGALPPGAALREMRKRGITHVASLGTPIPEALAALPQRQFPASVATDPDACADMLDWACPGQDRISVVVPTWQSAAWIEARLRSIFAQTAPVHEVIVLDDASTDRTVEIALQTAKAAGRMLRLHQCEQNSGNVTHQWRLACEIATGELLWIAEADDLAEPRFLETMAGRMRAAPDSIFAFCDSGEIDANGNVRSADRKPYYAAMGDVGLALDSSLDAERFARSILAPRNLVLTSSAVLWRRARLASVFAELGARALDFRFAGDWQVYLQACTLPGTVHYCADPMVQHRRHQDSVIGSAGSKEHFAEVQRIHAAIARRYPDDAGLMARLERHRKDLSRLWDATGAEDVPAEAARTAPEQTEARTGQPPQSPAATEGSTASPSN